DAHRVYQLKSHEHPVSIPCTPLVHGPMGGGKDGGRRERRGGGWGCILGAGAGCSRRGNSLDWGLA
ncbi:MAG: hypothetical protein QM840_09510, partial [Verrucomicrobiota bacterium]|nr:hypothetical protein [Verrucomicrobiota bacterium]